MKLVLPMIVFLMIISVTVAMFSFGKARIQRVLQEQLAAYRRADYQGQLRIIEGLRVKGSEPTYYLFFRGTAFFELGRLPEAEKLLRRSLSAETEPAQKILCMDQIGRVLMEQERWDDAAACFQQCIAGAPQRGGCHRAMAELLLRREKQPEAALEAARAALAAERAQRPSRDPLGKETHRNNLSESLAVYAWALATNHGDPAEAEAALKEALALCPETTKPIATEIHFCAGHAYALLGNAAESQGQFKRATEIDPAGNYGRLCQAMMSTVNS